MTSPVQVRQNFVLKRLRPSELKHTFHFFIHPQTPQDLLDDLLDWLSEEASRFLDMVGEEEIPSSIVAHLVKMSDKVAEKEHLCLTKTTEYLKSRSGNQDDCVVERQTGDEWIFSY